MHKVKIIGIEPFDTNAMALSLHHGQLVMLDQVGGFADGVTVQVVVKRYSFGIVLLEAITGRDPVDCGRPTSEVNLVDWLKMMVGSRRSEEVVDPNIETRPSTRALKNALLTALRCVDPDSDKRPRMTQVVRMLESEEYPIPREDMFEEKGSILEPTSALALSGAAAYCECYGLKGENVVAVTSGANMNFDRLRLVTELADVGRRQEAVLATYMPEKPGSFTRFCGTYKYHRIQILI